VGLFASEWQKQARCPILAVVILSEAQEVEGPASFNFLRQGWETTNLRQLRFLGAKAGSAVSHKKRKEPPGNRAAPSSGRIVPTEAKPSELSGCIVGAMEGSVKDKSAKK
jgi:hypothetical protein